MSPHGKKKLAPMIISAVIALYYIGFAAVCLLVEGVPLVLRIALGVLPLIPVGFVCFMLWERFREIDSGEEDDLDQY
ncbi:MAG: hypothetical protein IJU29_07180 [Oscillospiraceae bacterium]|nr:hypothetical protein [Oscillospiraceae bacterium]